MHKHKLHNSSDTKHVFVIFFIFFMVGSICVAREIYVDVGSQAETADGSKAQPFKTITEGLNIIKAGDTVIVREGIYRESARVPGGEPNNPVTLKAAEGERVVLSGAIPVTGWEEHRENIYVTVLDFKPERLLVAYRPQQIAREPNEGWWRAMAVDDMTITDTRNLKTLGHSLVAEEAYVWTMAGNVRATGYDLQSVYGDPEFRNAPKAFAVLDFRRIVDCTRDTFYIGSSTRSFMVGDTVEVDFDGVGRKVMSRSNETITVSPELRTKPLKPILICNWGQNSDLSLDLRLTSGSPGAKLSSTGGPVGSTIDINAYRRGDFNADGTRDLPNMPPELKPESEGKQDTAKVLKSVDEK